MSENDPRENTSEVKPIVPTLRELVTRAMIAVIAYAERAIVGLPVIERGKVYTRKQVIGLCAISNQTLLKWEASGLRVLGAGSKTSYYLGDDLIDFWTNPEPAPNVAKTRQRKRGA